MLAMEYKGFVWPNNPYTCKLELQRDMAVHAYPGGGYQLEELGQRRRALSGRGEFFGPQAYVYMTRLLRVYEEEGPGVLIHPVVELQRAYFTELIFLEEPRENYAAYTFLFLEDGRCQKEAGGEGSVGYTVRKWDTLWDIAKQYDTDVETLLALNPWISNPGRLEAGKRVTLP